MTIPSSAISVVHCDIDLARRLEGLEVEVLRTYAAEAAKLRPRAGIVCEPVSSGYMLFAGWEPTNHAVGLGMNGTVSPGDLDRLKTFYHSRGVPVEIVVCPLADSSLLPELSTRGYGVKEMENVLIRRLFPNEQFPTSSDLVLRKPTVDERDLYSRTVCQGFFGDQGSAMPEDIVTHFLPFQIAPNATPYLAFDKDGNAIAAAGGMYSHEQKTIALFGSATLAKYRNRGAQTALIRARLAEALRMGGEYATINTMPGTISQRNAERAGFHVAYTKVTLTLPL